MILCSDPHAQYLAHQEEIDSVIHKVLDSGQYILGPQTQAFEDEFAEYIGVSHCVGVNNGTDAIQIALKACGIRVGDEVITVSHTAVATVAAITQAGARPVLADIEPASYTMEMASLESLITRKTRAIIPVHLYGHPAPMKEIMVKAHQNDIFVIEDCAQAHGATIGGEKVGSFGDLACFSFYPTKNLGALGDGGAVVSNNQKFADEVRLLREYGWEKKFISRRAGWNSRLDEIQAAVLRVKLKFLESFNRNRLELANEYLAELDDLDLKLPIVREGYGHVFHLFVVRSEMRDKLQQYLIDNGVAAAIHYPVPVHQQVAYADKSRTLKNTERVCQEILSLPIYPELGDNINKVIAVIRKFYRQGNKGTR